MTTTVDSLRVVLRSAFSVDFPYIALKNEESLVVVRPRPESHCSFITKSEICPKEHFTREENENSDQVHRMPKDHAERDDRPELSYSDHSPSTEFGTGHLFRRVEPITSVYSDLEPSELDIPCILPGIGRLYCNVLFEYLERGDKILYEWILPSGAIFHRRSFLKVLGQEKTWSWNYIDVSDERARQNPGKWNVEIRVNDRFVGRVFFEMLNDVIDVKDKGVLPIILSCPHGHPDAINFTKILGSHLNTMFGCFPSIVISKIDPTMLDLDASEESINTDLVPYHRSYYQIIRSNIKRILTLQRRVPLLVNIKLHDDGQPLRVGTLDGASLKPMRVTARRAGDPRFGEHGIMTKLRRWSVRPSHERQADEAGYAGGNLLRTFASDESEARISGIDLFLPRELVLLRPEHAVSSARLPLDSASSSMRASARPTRESTCRVKAPRGQGDPARTEPDPVVTRGRGAWGAGCGAVPRIRLPAREQGRGGGAGLRLPPPRAPRLRRGLTGAAPERRLVLIRPWAPELERRLARPANRIRRRIR